MKYNPDIHHRRSIRLPRYDYSRAGAYFVSICTLNRACLFGDVVDGKMVLNDAGRMLEKCWGDIPTHFPHVGLDEFVIMPTHVHGIIVITDGMGTGVGAKNFSPLQSPPTDRGPCGTSKTIGSVVRGFKIGVTKWMRQNTLVQNVWQRNYYEHVIRNENELTRIRQYIINNPAKWEYDRENPHHDVRVVHEPSPNSGNESWMT